MVTKNVELEDAYKAVAQDRRERVQRCVEEMKASLERHRCQMVVTEQGAAVVPADDEILNIPLNGDS